jgi:TfoX/Sxy family transcriptional regulator of competence genes
MAYDTELADRIRDTLATVPDVTERKMFGGLAFLVAGKMSAVASGRGGLMVRTDPALADHVIENSAAEMVEMQGRVMKGWLHLDSNDVQSDVDLDVWIDRALSYRSRLPGAD